MTATGKSSACRACGVKLTVGENWAIGNAKRNNCKCKGCNAAYDRKYYKEHRGEIIDQAYKYYQVHREAINARRREGRPGHREEINIQKRKYYQKHREEIISKHRERCQADIQFKLACNLRARLYSAIRGNYKAGSAIHELGCSIPSLKNHLEKQFYGGISWENRSEWRIHHIQPLEEFDLTDGEQVLQAGHYTNLQPL